MARTTPLTRAVPAATPPATSTAPTGHNPLSSVAAAWADQAPVNAAVIVAVTSHGCSSSPAPAASSPSDRTHAMTCAVEYGPLSECVAGSIWYSVSWPNHAHHTATVQSASGRAVNTDRFVVVMASILGARKPRSPEHCY